MKALELGNEMKALELKNVARNFYEEFICLSPVDTWQNR